VWQRSQPDGAACGGGVASVAREICSDRRRRRRVCRLQLSRRWRQGRVGGAADGERSWRGAADREGRGRVFF
jgi:hypothetical protein